MKKIVTFKNNGGRTGNLIFQYMICKLLELKFNCHEYKPYSPEYDHFLEITDGNFIEMSSPSSFFSEILQKQNIICEGYFQKSIFFVEDRIELLKKMRESTEDYWILEGKKYFISDFFKENPRYNPGIKDVVISLRLDDFIQYPCPTSDIIPPQYYLNILENMNFNNRNNQLYIICDKVKYDWEYRYLELFNKWNPIYVIGDTLLKDGALMRDCYIFLHSNSTFSWLMSFFSQNPEKQRYIVCTDMYKVQLLEHINVNKDIVSHIKPLSHQEVHDLVLSKK
jgi:hypothetical protein